MSFAVHENIGFSDDEIGKIKHMCESHFTAQQVHNAMGFPCTVIHAYAEEWSDWKDKLLKYSWNGQKRGIWKH